MPDTMTDAEHTKALVRKRVSAFSKRQHEAGRQACKVWATPAEIRQLRAVLAAWRGEASELDPALVELVLKLKP